MHPKHFINKLDEASIVEAIKRAEQATSGEIRVTVSHSGSVNTLSAAKKYFQESGMARIPNRNAVLIYFTPREHTFAIWGDIGVHDKCGDLFWQQAANRISSHLKAGHLTQGIEEAVRDVGAMLAQHFPCTAKGSLLAP